MGRIRLGIVGLGHMAEIHFRGLTDILDLADITACCDIDPAHLEKGARALSLVAGHEGFACTNYREMLPYVDAVELILPHHLHCEAGLFFAAHKKHILMESRSRTPRKSASGSLRPARKTASR